MDRNRCSHQASDLIEPLKPSLFALSMMSKLANLLRQRAFPPATLYG
jgi:hypothetical protein